MLFTPVADADLLDFAKETIKKTRETARDIKETISEGKSAQREVESVTQTIIYSDSYLPPREELRRLQMSLNRLGYSTGTPDGLMGKRTRTAIKQYQTRIGVAATGNMSYELVQDIVRAGLQAPVVTAPVELSRAEWRSFQSQLNALGYNTGVPDGIPGRKTRAAIQRFMQDRGVTYVPGRERDGFDLAKRLAGQAGRETVTSSRDKVVGSGDTSVVESQPANRMVSVEESKVRTGNPLRFSRYGEGGVEASLAVALRFAEAYPTILDDRELLNNWFTEEGRTVESSYFLDNALNEFRVELLQRASDRSEANRSALFAMSVDVAVRKGSFDTEAGLFPVDLSFGDFSVHPPQFYSSMIKLDLEQQLPLVQSQDGGYQQSLAIPMTLEQAINFEDQLFATASKSRNNAVSMVLDIHFYIDELVLLDQANTGTSTISANAATRLQSLTLHQREFSTPGNVGGLVYRWPVESKAEVAAVDNSVEGIARRFGMQTIDGYLSLDSGNVSAFAASIVVGSRPDLIEQFPASLHLSQALLPAAEQRRLFGGRYVSSMAPDDAERIHETIQSTLKERLQSFGIDVEVPVVLQHEVTADSSAQGSRNLFLEHQKKVRSGFSPVNRDTVVNTGARWVPESVAMITAQADALSSYLSKESAGSPRTRLTMARYGTVKLARLSLNGRPDNNRHKFILQAEIQREALFSQRLRDLLYEFPSEHTQQPAYDDLLAVLTVPITNQATLLSRLESNPDVVKFRDALIEARGVNSDTNEFNRAEHIEAARQNFVNEIVPEPAPLWVAGQAKLGQYDLENNQFSVETLTIGDIGRTSGGYFSGSISFEFSELPNVPVRRSVAEQMVQQNREREFRFAARILPVAAIGSQLDQRYAKLKIRMDIAEMHLLSGQPRDERQSRALLGSYISEVNPEKFVSANESEDANGGRVVVELGETPTLTPEVLMLLSAQSADLQDNSVLEGLLLERWYQESSNRPPVAPRFFATGAKTPDRLSAQVQTSTFRRWLEGLEFPEIKELKLFMQLSPNVRLASRDDFCHGLVSDIQELRGQSGVSADASESLQSQRKRLRSLKAEEYFIADNVGARFVTPASTDCGIGRRASQRHTNAEAIVPLDSPNFTVTFDQLPVYSNRSGAVALVTAKVANMTHISGKGSLDDINLDLIFTSADVLDTISDDARVVLSVSASELANRKNQDTIPRLVATDVVGVSPGATLSEANELVLAHLTNPRKYISRREFSTAPKPFQQADFWVDESSNEYIALLHEGDEQGAVVQGIFRGVRLPGIPFDRQSAISSLREKYGAEQLIKADRRLNMAWGAYVDKWPDSVDQGARLQGMGPHGGGACRLSWGRSQLPAQMKGEDDASYDWREIIGGITQQSFLQWPEARYDLNVIDECAISIEAMHSDQSDAPVVFVGVVDLNGYKAAYENALEAISLASRKDVSTDKPKVKF
jgi:peptidoglycan hydrolase-like protein with peptidoglycan-binding domain